MSHMSQCSLCLNRKNAETCRAFPGGIPDDIYRGQVDHRTAQPNDQGIHWEAIEDGIEWPGLSTGKP